MILELDKDSQIATPEGWVKVPTLAELKQDLADSKPIHDAQVTKVDGWLDHLNITGSAVIKPTKGQSSIQPQLIRKQAEWRYASLSEPFLSTDDIFNVRPVTFEDRDAAKQNELLLNHQLNNKIDKVAFIDEMVRTAVDEGTLIIQVGWEFYEEEYEEEVQNIEFRVNPELAPMHQHLAEMKKNSPSEYDTDVPDEMKQAHDLSIEYQQPIEAVPVEGTTIVEKTRTICNKPTLEVCNFRNIFIDPSAKGDYDKANFIIKSYVTCKSALKKDGKKYQNLDKINIANNSVLASADYTYADINESNFNLADEARKQFVVYQYWGKRDVLGKGIITSFVSEWVGNVMIRLEDSPFPDKKLPFIIEHYLPVRKSNYGEPDGALLIENQKIIGAVTRGMIDIMGKSANGQTGTGKGLLDTVNRRKFDLGQNYEFNGGQDPRQGIFMHVYPEIPNSAQFMLQLQNQEAESMTGVKSWNQGVSGAALGDVAAGVRGALDAASKRELGILRRLSNAMIKVGRKMISMNSEFLSDEEVVRVTNKQFVKIRRDDLPGEFDLKLSISTAEEDNNKAEQLAFMLQTAGPNMDPELFKMILSDIATLRKMPDVAERISSYKPEPDPIAQKMQELELAKIEAEIAETQAKTQKILVEAGLVDAKTNTEGAKASHLSAVTDKTNLDFVEQERGVKQERDLQKQGEQARANTQMKVIEQSFKERQQDKKILADYLTKKDKP